MKKLRLGFIGAGFISQLVHLPCIYYNSRASIVAISDKDQKLLDKVKNKYNIPKAYLSHEELFKKEKLDGAVIAVQRSETAKVTRSALLNKIPIIVEKPSALNYKQAKFLFELSKKKKVKYFVGYMKRHDNGILQLKKIIKQNNYGKLMSVNFQAYGGDSYSNPFEYFKHSEKNYRIKNSLINKVNNKKIIFVKYLNNYCHHINLLQYLFGKIKIDYKSISSSGEGVVIFKNNKKLKIIFNNQFTKAKRWIEEMNIFFEHCKILVKMPIPLLKNTSASIEIEDYNSGEIRKPFVKWGWAFKNQADNFINSIYKKKAHQNLCSGKESCEDIKIIEDIFKQ